MECRQLYSLVLVGTLASSLWGCSPKESDPQPLHEPSSTPPAGVVEVSRLSGIDASSSPSSPDKSGQSVKSESATPADKGDLNKSTTNSASDVEHVSGQMSDKSSDVGMNNVKSSDTMSVSANSDGIQTLNTTAITARGDNPWTLDAKKVQYDESSKRVRVSSIVWSLLDKQNQPRLTVYGKAADVNIESQNVAFDGPVEAKGSEGEKMKVNHLVWDSAKQKILGTHGVRVVRQGTVMTGDNLVSSPDLKQVEISGNVRVTFVDPAAPDNI